MSLQDIIAVWLQTLHRDGVAGLAAPATCCALTGGQKARINRSSTADPKPHFCSANMLARLIYVSEAMDGIKISEVESILSAARRSNQLKDISGMLLFNRESFLQVIEGDAEVLTGLYGRISADTRHRRLKLLQFVEVEQRLFDEWSMGFAGESESNRHVFLRHTASSHFRPYDLNASSALALLLRLARPASVNVAVA